MSRDPAKSRPLSENVKRMMWLEREDLSYAYWLGYIYRCECILHDESSRMMYSAFTEDIMQKANQKLISGPMRQRNLSDCAKEICADLDRLLVEEIWPQKKQRKYM